MATLSDEAEPRQFMGLAEGYLRVAYSLSLRLVRLQAREEVCPGGDVGTLAKQLGGRPALTRSLIVVAKAFGPEEFDRLASGRCRNGATITIEHLAVLARAPRKHRDELIAAMFEECLTPPQLASLVKVRKTSRRSKI
jgi:hypothetical protein